MKQLSKLTLADISFKAECGIPLLSTHMDPGHATDTFVMIPTLLDTAKQLSCPLVLTPPGYTSRVGAVTSPWPPSSGPSAAAAAQPEQPGRFSHPPASVSGITQTATVKC
jgi:hypothetical protein